MSTAVAEKPKRHHRKNYNDEEKDLALQAWIRSGGHKERASDALTVAGCPVPASTLRDWATKSETDRLNRIRQELGPIIKAEQADMHQALASAAGEIEAKAIKRLNEKLDNDEIEAKDLSSVMQRGAITTGIHGDKHLLFTGQPTQIVQRNLSEALRELGTMGITIEGTAVEVDPGDSKQ